jgi:type IV pilus assembly protein PilF
VKRTKILSTAGLALLFLSACVTEGDVTPEPKIDVEDAAMKYYRLGALYYRQGSYALAKDRLEKSLAANPRLPEAHSTLALTYEKLGNLVAAEQHYDRAIKLAPANANVRNTYAVFLCQQRRFDEAGEQFTKASSTSGNSHPEVLLTNAGVCFAQKPDLARSESYFREALRYNANYGEALLQMALLMYRNDNSMLARAFVQRFLMSNPATAEVLYLGVQIESALGDDDARSDLAGRLLRDFPTSAEARQIMESGYDVR